MKVELIPVLEVPVTPEACRLLPTHPPGNFRQHPAEWDDYQRQLLSAGFFADYPRVIPGYNFVPLDQWSLPDLRRLVKNHLLGADEMVAVADSCALFGGSLLLIDDVPVLGPQCCSTLAEICDWQQLVSPGFEAGFFCFEGHPSPRATRRKDMLIIECQDDYESFDPPAQPHFVVEVDRLAEAIATAETAVRQFAQKIDLLSGEFGVPQLSAYLVWAKS